MKKSCYSCGSDKEELRPYGPKGAWVCFKCAFATPESKRETEHQFDGQLEAAARESDVVVIGSEVGPYPLRHNP